METERLSRREAFSRAGVLAAGMAAGPLSPTAVGAQRAPAGKDVEFVYCLNTGTIRGQELGIVREVEVAQAAGYAAIEPWVSDIDRYAKEGGSLEDLRKRIAEAGLTVESAISFSQWIVDDDARRSQAVEQAKREMELVARIGGSRMAAPPAGATREPGLDLSKAAERYRGLLEAGAEIGVAPQLELWGFSANLHRLGEAAYVLIESGHPSACLMPDTFHIYKGGSDFVGLRFFSAAAIQVYHMNDYPAEPPREQANDGHRIFPGDGVAPTAEILRALAASGGRKVLSLELFNREYWKQAPLEVARNGLRKMRESVTAALG
jgi:sugar phosphate isomerase/epimerase